MSETLSIESVEPQVIEAQGHELEPRSPSYINPEIDDSELFSLIAQNANVMVEFNGSNMTLSEVMSYVVITQETMGSVIALALELLANRAAESEESEEENKPEGEDQPEDTSEQEEVQAKEEPSKKEETPSPKPENSAKTEVSPRKADARAQVEETPKVETLGAQKQSQESIKAEQPEPPARAISNAESASDTFSAPENLASVNHRVPVEAPAIITRPVESSAAEPIRQELELAIESQVEAKSPVPALLETQPLILPAFELAPEPEPAGGVHFVIEDRTLTDNAEELVDEIIETTEDEPDIIFPDYQLDIVDLANKAEVEVVLGLTQTDLPPESVAYPDISTVEYVEDNPETTQATLIFEPDGALDLSESVEAVISEPSVEISSTIEEIETSLTELVNRIEASQPEIIRAANDSLERVMQLSTRLEIEANDINSEVQELEELFIELFDTLGISYAPETAEILTGLTFQRRLAAEITNLKKEETRQASQGVGTHEIIKRLLKCLNTVKKATMQAGMIGRSALRLYNFSSA